MVDLLEPGDAILVLDLDGSDTSEPARGTTTAADHRGSLARAVTDATRATDVLVMTERGVLVVLLLDPAPETPLAVYERVTDRWDDRDVGRSVRAATVVCDGDAPRESLKRALAQLRKGGRGLIQARARSTTPRAADG
jgi:hypothetical protein